LHLHKQQQGSPFPPHGSTAMLLIYATYPLV